jgi:hypothetical protein
MDDPEYDPEADSIGSFYAAIRAIGERVKAGEPLPTGGYFARKRITVPRTARAEQILRRGRSR